MKLVTSYILKEHIGPFFFSLATIVFVFILNLVFRDLGRLLGKGIPAHIILEFFLLNMAWMAALAIPMAVLVASLMAFGRLSQDNEITALKASGINLYRLIAPIFIASTFLAFGMERFNNIVLPEFNHRVKQLYSDMMKKQPTASIEPNVFFNDIDGYALLVQKIDKDKLEGIILNDNTDAEFSKTIIAEKGTLHFSEEEERMILALENGEIHEVENADLENYRRGQFEKQVFSIPMENIKLERSDSQHRGDREKSVSMMREDIAQNQRSIQKKERQIEKRVALHFQKTLPEAFWIEINDTTSNSANTFRIRKRRIQESRREVQSLVHQIHGEKSSIKGYRSAINRSLVEIHKKFSIPVACMVFVLIGAPLGIMARHGGLATGGGLSMIFFLVYWAFLIGGEQLGDRGFVGPIVAMWAPNILVGGIGVFLVVRTVKETTFIPWEEWSKRITDLFRKKHG
ncbi:YjgP/YjgQ family permease [candidate division KSB1 bacterium]|nr:YjgP/YjgQ family permease [candidate division KSB1 bacterium]